MGLEWLDVAKQIQSIAQAGLTFSTNKYDTERYNQLREISIKIVNEFTGIDMQKIKDIFASETGYQTPKVDVRGVVFREEKILMVRETIDGLWSIPGGWADVGLTPTQVAVKEVREESGLEVQASRLLAVLDKRSHTHPPDLFHVYKIFILCNETGGELTNGMETSDVGFFGLNNLPPLSLTRITREQIELMYEFKNNPGKEVICD